ncbi:MAG TPA: AAA family ATPase [Acidimicrobiales bacterium]|nr:AAA family ATPase [Acidimicrobiales bacterium]
MIVAIDGPQHSGKTTCLESLREHPALAKVHFVEEVARDIAPRFGVSTTDDWCPLLEDRVRLAEFFDAEYDALHALEVDPAIVDGSALLVTAYQRVFLDASAEPKYEPQYDRIFLCEPWGTPQSDGFRFLAGQVQVLDAYRTLLVELGLFNRLVELPATEDRLVNLKAHPVWRRILSRS